METPETLATFSSLSASEGVLSRTHSYLIFATLYKESLHSDDQQFHQYTSK